MSVTSIDDLLQSDGKLRDSDEYSQENMPEDILEEETSYEEGDGLYDDSDESDDDNDSSSEEITESSEFDEYGNEKAAARMYSEEEVNERINKAIRQRLSRGGNESPPHPQQPHALPENQNEADWRTELEQFIESSVSKMEQQKIQRIQEQKENEIESRFREKLVQGMNGFKDFEETVDPQPITPAMRYALRTLEDPAAFIYAASKQKPEELKRISGLADPFAQAREIGRLEESLRKGKETTKAPRPLTRVKEDSSISIQKSGKNEETIEDLIAKSQAKILKQRELRRR